MNPLQRGKFIGVLITPSQPERLYQGEVTSGEQRHMKAINNNLNIISWPSWAGRPNETSGFRGRKELLNRASALVTACP